MHVQCTVKPSRRCLMQVLKVEGAADSTRVFSIFSGMDEMTKTAPQPLDLHLGRQTVSREVSKLGRSGDQRICEQSGACQSLRSSVELC